MEKENNYNKLVGRRIAVRDTREVLLVQGRTHLVMRSLKESTRDTQEAAINQSDLVWMFLFLDDMTTPINGGDNMD